MVTCTGVPVALSQGGPTNREIKDIVCLFLNEWRSADPEALAVKKNAGVNRNYTVERPTNGDADQGSRKVFLKLHTDQDVVNDIFKSLVPSKHEEAQLCHDYGQSGRGAKVYGFFRTRDGTLGRVDEFLDARDLVSEDVEDAGIRADVARAQAAFHAMKTQLRENQVQDYYDIIIRQLKKYHKMDKLKRLVQEQGINMDDLVDYDFASNIPRITERLESMGGKTGWCIHDNAFMNVLARNNPKPGESKVVLIDFEFVFRNYRAFDIGGHFMQKVFRWTADEDGKLPNRRPYTEEEKRHFCDEYAQQWNQETGDSDTGEQVWRESELGYLLAMTFDMHAMLCYVEQDADGELLNMLDIEAFSKLFTEFTGLYKSLGLDHSKREE